MFSLLCLSGLTVALAASHDNAARLTASVEKSGVTSAKSVSIRKPVLDTVLVHEEYMDGDFDVAIDNLETALKSGGAFSHEDSVFIFKHLGVMYTARYETRELGKRHMIHLLEVEPTARIMDMYASDMIYMIFKNIQDEFEVAQAKLHRAQEHVDGAVASGPLPDKQPAPAKPERNYTWVPWTIGAVAAVGGSILVYTMMDQQKPAKKENTIP